MSQIIKNLVVIVNVAKIVKISIVFYMKKLYIIQKYIGNKKCMLSLYKVKTLNNDK